MLRALTPRWRRIAVSALVCAALTMLSSAAPAMPCYGDCDESGVLTVDELIRGVAVALGTVLLEECPIIDVSGDGFVTVEEIIIATNYALHGCPPPDTPTPTSTGTPTRSGTPTITNTRTATETSTSTATPTVTGSATPTPTGNRPPELTCQDVYRTFPGQPIEFQIETAVPSEDLITFSPNNLPAGASLDESGVFRWTPGATQTGPFYVRFTATDSGTPPLATEGELMFKVSPLDACTLPTCAMQSGCTSELLSIDESCCAGLNPRAAEPFAACPQGRVVFLGRPGEDHFQRLHNCDGLIYMSQFQTGATLIFDIQTRCLRTDRDIRVHAYMETALRRPAIDQTYMIEFDPEDDGFFVARDQYFEILGPDPFFDLDSAEANLTVTLTDADGVTATARVRVVTTRNFLSPLPDLDHTVLPPEPGPCNNFEP